MAEHGIGKMKPLGFKAVNVDRSGVLDAAPVDFDLSGTVSPDPKPEPTAGEVIGVNDEYFTNPGLSNEKNAAGLGSVNIPQAVPNFISQSSGRYTVNVLGDPDRINEFLKELNEAFQDMLNEEYTDLRASEVHWNTYSDPSRVTWTSNRNF